MDPNKQEDDRIAILDNEIEESFTPPNDIQGVITNAKPKRHFIDPVLFFLFISFSLYEIILPNAVEIQFCQARLNITAEKCLNTTKENLDKLQRFTSMFQIARSVIEVTIPSFISFFVGPWSDTYGRKPLILSSAIGYSVSYALWTFGSSIRTLDPMYFLLFSFPLAFSGGGTIMVLGTFCYVCDVTTLENRGARLGRLQASLFLGSLVGTQLCPVLLPYGYTLVFGVASAFLYLMLIYTYYFIDETIVPSQIELNSVNKNPFNLQHVRGLYESCYTKQTPKVRFTIAILIVILSCSLINVFGESGVMYLFLQNVLNWDLKQYTTMSSFVIIFNIIGAFGGTWLFCYKLKLDDLFVLNIATFLRLLSSVVMIFGNKVWHIYFAKLLSCSVGMTGPLIRSFLSRVIAKDELGKVFSLLASTESMTPLLATLAYSTLYNWTLSSLPGAIFYLSAFMILIVQGLLTLLFEVYTSDRMAALSKSRIVSQNTPSINVD